MTSPETACPVPGFNTGLSPKSMPPPTVLLAWLLKLEVCELKVLDAIELAKLDVSALLLAGITPFDDELFPLLDVVTEVALDCGVPGVELAVVGSDEVVASLDDE